MKLRWSRRRLALLALVAAGGCGGGEEEGVGQGAEVAERAPNTAAPAAEMRVRAPDAVETRLLPPGAVIGTEPDAGAPELVFSTAQAPARLLEWFRGTANGPEFTLETEMQEGAEHVFSGRVRATGEAFMVRLAPGVTGGTTGTIMVTRN